jgi:hypothetical protein
MTPGTLKVQIALLPSARGRENDREAPASTPNILTATSEVATA